MVCAMRIMQSTAQPLFGQDLQQKRSMEQADFPHDPARIHPWAMRAAAPWPWNSPFHVLWTHSSMGMELIHPCTWNSEFHGL